MKIEAEYIKANQNVDKGTTSHRTATERTSVKGAYTVDISGSVMDNSAYKGQGKTTEDIMSEASGINVATMRDYMTVMSNSMSEEDFAALREEGFPFGSIPAEEVVTVVDRIKAELIKAGINIEGYTDTLGKSAIEEIAGSSSVEALISQKLKEYDLPDTKENQEQIKNALDTAKNFQELNEGTLKYMVENQTEPTIENIYKAQYSASQNTDRQAKGYFFEETQGYYGKKAEFYDWEKLMPQIEKVIQESGQEVNEESIENSKWLIEKGIPLTEKNFTFLGELKQLVFPQSTQELCDRMAKAIANQEAAKDANLFEQPYFLKEALNIKEETESISEQAVEKAVSEAKKITIETLVSAQKELDIPEKKQENSQKQTESEAEIKAKRQLEEIRLQMSVAANLRLLKKGISIRTQELSELVEILKAEENSFPAKLWEETLDRTAQIKNMPADIIKDIAASAKHISLLELHHRGSTLQKNYETAEKTYEAVMTAPRSDLGDSIKKAFRNVDDILKEMDLEVNSYNQRAVRILGYNNMEITQDSVAAVKEADLSLQRALNKMTPDNTLKLIREGINPLEISLEELEKNLDEFSKEEQTEIDKYAKFLHKLEKNNQIKEEEKEAYIGIYRLMKQVEKSDGAVIGSLVNQGAEINFKNLLSAVRSNKQKGMNVTVNDSFGSLESLNGRENTISQQITNYYNKLAQEIGEKIEPEKISELVLTENTTLEEIAEMINSAKKISQQETEYRKEEFEEFQKNSKTEDFIIKTLLDYNQPVTMDHLISAESVMTVRGEMYRSLESYTQKEHSVEKEEELLQKLEGLRENFNGKEEVNDAFSQLKEKVEQMVQLSMDTGSMKAEDFKALSLLYKQISFTTQMAKEENYEIPIKVNGELTSVNVKILHNKNETAKVSITMQTELFGKAAAEFKLEDGKVNGFFVLETGKDADKLQDIEEQFSKIMEKNGLQKGSIHVTESRKLNIQTFGRKEKPVQERVSDKELYQIAKSFIFALQKA